MPTLKQFSSFRDALSKALYSRLFSWLVKKANAVISKADKDMSLAILDIFGFEVHMGVRGNTFAVPCVPHISYMFYEIRSDKSLMSANCNSVFILEF